MRHCHDAKQTQGRLFAGIRIANEEKTVLAFDSVAARGKTICLRPHPPQTPGWPIHTIPHKSEKHTNLGDISPLPPHTVVQA